MSETSFNSNAFDFEFINSSDSGRATKEGKEMEIKQKE